MSTPISIGLLLLDALLLWLVIGARGRWSVKLTAMVLVITFNFFVWQSAGSFSGWPAHRQPPPHSVFLWGEVNEPDASRHDPGAIYLWLVPVNERYGVLGYRPSVYEPRAYRLPYSRKLHQATNKALALQRAGQGTVGFDRSNQAARTANGEAIPRWAYRVYRFPPIEQPTKTGG